MAKAKMTVDKLAAIIDHAIRDYEAILDGICLQPIPWDERHESVKRQRRHVAKAVLAAMDERRWK